MDSLQEKSELEKEQRILKETIPKVGSSLTLLEQSPELDVSKCRMSTNIFLDYKPSSQRNSICDIQENSPNSPELNLNSNAFEKPEASRKNGRIRTTVFNATSIIEDRESQEKSVISDSNDTGKMKIIRKKDKHDTVRKFSNSENKNQKSKYLPEFSVFYPQYNIGQVLDRIASKKEEPLSRSQYIYGIFPRKYKYKSKSKSYISFKSEKSYKKPFMHSGKKPPSPNKQKTPRSLHNRPDSNDQQSSGGFSKLIHDLVKNDDIKSKISKKGI